MAQGSNGCIISSKFIKAKGGQVTVERLSGDLVIKDTDNKNKILLRIRSCDTKFHRQRLLLDGRDTPIAMLREMNKTIHGRWNVFRGNSTAKEDMIFSAAKIDIVQGYTAVMVSLSPSLSPGDDCDFKIKGSYGDGKSMSCTILEGKTCLAQMDLTTSQEIQVQIYANVDYAFVLTLIAIVDAMNSPSPKQIIAGKVAGIFTSAALAIGGIVAAVIG